MASLTHTGPSVNMKVHGGQGREYFDCDFLLSLPVAGWPAPAREWRTRSRSWPRQETVYWLATLPCHVIPKPSKEGDKESWRFSFSCQEVEISTILPNNARLCYIALKLIFKKYLQSICSSLKSYHFLTLFFWFMEQNDPTIWIQTNWSETSFKSILSKLMLFVAEALNTANIPHYFIRSVNLVANMKKDEVRFENVPIQKYGPKTASGIKWQEHNHRRLTPRFKRICKKDSGSIEDVSKHILQMVYKKNFPKEILF